MTRRKDQKATSLFSHLPSPKHEPTPANLHPSVCLLGLQIKSFKISGANARCKAMLEAFNELIHDYQTPKDKDLTHDLIICLNKHIDFISKIRPLCAPMGNAIRQLKKEITSLGPINDVEAKQILQNKINQYIYERITVPITAISSFGRTKINHNDVILTFGHSSTVFELLRSVNVKFRVIVVTCRPKMEGLKMAAKLLKLQIPCTLVHLTALSHVIRDATKVILGANAMLANGALVSRIGTAQVATMAHFHNVPVIIACETYKFSMNVHLDSIVFNELGPDELSLQVERPETLQVLNLLFDVTPPEFITVVITELGLIPCSSVRVIIREYMPLIEPN